eukprot:14150938-Heterocapsa_arctica.AAC.2
MKQNRLLGVVRGILADAKAHLLQLDLGGDARQAVLGLELLNLVEAHRDKIESHATAAAELRDEAEELDGLEIVHVVRLRQLHSK